MKPRILFIIATCLSLIVACKCVPVQPSQVASRVDALVQIDAVHMLGSIDFQNFVFRVEGSIEDNQLKGQNKVVVLCLKDNVEIKEAAQNFIHATQLNLKAGELIYLPDEQGIAYYEQLIPEHYHGDLSIGVHLPAGSVVPGEKYYVYVLVGGEHSAQWVAYSEVGKEIIFPAIKQETPASTATLAPTPPPTVTMGAAIAILDHTQQGFPVQFSLQAEVLDKKHKLEAGFLLAKQDYDADVIKNILAKFIAQDKKLVSGMQLKALEGFPGCFIASNINPDFSQKLGTVNMSLADYDEANQLEKGSTYQVYAYVCDGQQNYILSPQASLLTIPKFDVELEMQEVAIANLIGSTEDLAIKDLKLQLKFNMVQHGYTINPPYLGFLFTRGKQTDAEAALAIVQDTVHGTLTAPSFKYKDDNIVCIANQLHTDVQNGNLEFTVAVTEANLILGESYMIYCWLYDDGNIFISKNAVNLALPALKFEANFVKSDYQATSSTPINIKMHHQVTEVKNIYLTQGKQEIYYLFNLYDEENNQEVEPLTVSSYQNILNKARVGLNPVADPTNPSAGRLPTVASTRCMVLLKAGVPTIDSKKRDDSWSLTCTMQEQRYHPFKELSKYKIYIIFRVGNVLLYSAPSPQDLETHKELPIASAPKIIQDPDGNPDVYYEVQVVNRAEIWYCDVRNATKKLLRKHDPLDMITINKIVPLVIKCSDEDEQKAAEEDFINRMP